MFGRQRKVSSGFTCSMPTVEKSSIENAPSRVEPWVSSSISARSNGM
jgi:hypothetical protein